MVKHGSDLPADRKQNLRRELLVLHVDAGRRLAAPHLDEEGGTFRQKITQHLRASPDKDVQTQQQPQLGPVQGDATPLTPDP